MVHSSADAAPSSRHLPISGILLQGGIPVRVVPTKPLAAKGQDAAVHQCESTPDPERSALAAKRVGHPESEPRRRQCARRERSEEEGTVSSEEKKTRRSCVTPR